MNPPLCSVRCSHCSMVQAVPAASSRGPAPQMRCLACHQPLTNDEDTRVTGRLQVPSAPVDEDWYAMVHDEAVGPLNRSQLVRLHESGMLDEDALVWHQGFRGWARLADTATFTRLVGGQRPAPRPARLPRPGLLTTSEVVDLTDHVEMVEMVEVVPPPVRRSPPRTATEPSVALPAPARPPARPRTAGLAPHSRPQRRSISGVMVPTAQRVRATGRPMAAALVATLVLVGMATLGSVGLVATAL